MVEALVMLLARRLVSRVEVSQRSARHDNRIHYNLLMMMELHVVSRGFVHYESKFYHSVK